MDNIENNNLLETVLNAYNEKLKDGVDADIPSTNEETLDTNVFEVLNTNDQPSRKKLNQTRNQNTPSPSNTSYNATLPVKGRKIAPTKPQRRNHSNLFMADLDMGEPLSFQSIIDSVSANSDTLSEDQENGEEMANTNDANENIDVSTEIDYNDSNNNPNKESDESSLPRTPLPTPVIVHDNPGEEFEENNRPSSSELEANCEKFLTSDMWFGDVGFNSDNNEQRPHSDGDEMISDNASNPEIAEWISSQGSRRRRKNRSSQELRDSSVGRSSDEDGSIKSEMIGGSPHRMRRGAGLSASIQSDLNMVGQNKLQRSRSTRNRWKEKGKIFGKDDKNIKKELGHLLDSAATNAKAKFQKFKKNKLKMAQSSPLRGAVKHSTGNGVVASRTRDKRQSEDDDLFEKRKNSASSAASLGGADKIEDASDQRVLKRGWLRKQGGMIKTWNERWFVLKGDRLYYYKDKDENKLLGTIMLPNNHVIEHPVRASEPNKFFFEIVPGGDRENLTKNHNTYMMSANSQNTMEEWVRIMRRVIKSPPGGGIFGQELNRTIRYETQIDNKLPPGSKRPRRQAPYIIETCCEFIRQNGGFHEEGLFRLPGQANEVKDLQDSFDMGERPSFDKSTDTHTVASLMKSFLRELPEPLVPFDQYTPMIDAAKLAIPGGLPSHKKISSEDNEEEACKAREIIKGHLEILPQENFELLRYLCRFLDEVQRYSKTNKMDIDNLALVFGPNIMRARKEEPLTMMSHASYVQHIMSEFIRNHKYLFPDDEIDVINQKSSIPDVAADAEEGNVMTTSPSTSSQRHQVFTDTVVSSHTTQTTSTDGFNTMTTQTTTSPPGTIGFRHITDDSGTGSLGPTPDNTSRRNIGAAPSQNTGSNFRPEVRPKPSSAIIEEGNMEIQSNGSYHPPTSNKPKYPPKAPRPHLVTDINRRESFYDNVTQSSETSSVGNAAKRRSRDKTSNSEWRRSNEHPSRTSNNPNATSDSTSQRSSYINPNSPVTSSPRSSTNAVAGSSVGSFMSGDIIDTPPYSPTLSMQDTDHQKFLTRNEPQGPKPPARKRRSKKAGVNSGRHPGVHQQTNYNSDEESNTESVPPDDRSDIRSMMSSRKSSVASISDVGHPRHQAPTKPTTRPPPPPYPSGHARSHGRSHLPSTTDSGSYIQPTYDELQENIRILQDKLVKQSGEFESRTRDIEEQLLRQIQELRFSTSFQMGDISSRRGTGSFSQASQVKATPSQYWRSGAESNLNDDASLSESVADTVSETIHFDPVTQRYDLESKLPSPKEFKSQDDELQYLQKCVSEERKLRQMAEIHLKNEKRGRLAAEERNAQLQKEMREFFLTFGSMFSNSESSSLQ